MNREIYFRAADASTGRRDRVTKPKNKKIASSAGPFGFIEL
jgi:hypothetical protein